MEPLENIQNFSYLEGLYQQYLEAKESLNPEWVAFFDNAAQKDLKEGFSAKPSFKPPSLFNPNGFKNGGRQSSSNNVLQERVDQLVRAYRVRGHLAAKIDPLGAPRPPAPELDPAFHGFSQADMDKSFSTENLGGADVRTLREILFHLKKTYCSSIGVQFMHIDDLQHKDWLQGRMESTQNRISLPREDQLRIYSLLSKAVLFEQFVQKKYLGAKSFSLEGAESLIPLLYMAIEKAGRQKIDEIVLGMAHRGRLNVLANILGKPHREIFREFEDKDVDEKFARGDVKYHLGYSRDWVTQAKHAVHLSLCFNPSHLEFINAVALGRVRAKQDHVQDTKRSHGMALLIHGDASFAGEGIVQETLNLSRLPGYAIGGTLHVIVNNQIGFTTTPQDGRSTLYATDVARMLEVPIFHVNGEDPEAVAQVVQLAMDYRQTFKRDVIIDMYCYRLHGHNESDEPTFTQPTMYQAIRMKKGVKDSYLERLLKMGGVKGDESETIDQKWHDLLEDEYSRAQKETRETEPSEFAGIWKGYRGGPYIENQESKTGVPAKRLLEIFQAQLRLPEQFQLNPKLKRFWESRQEMAKQNRPLDWSAAEALAFGTLLTEGYPIRFSGQDTIRGTFSQRHAALYDVENGKPYLPLNHLDPKQKKLEIINSPLSEAGVLGFEYGYSLDFPEGLILWEAQFGDFNNAAQVIIDQFIASAEYKWQRLSGIVLLLPHGFDGQGPEHSSARLERFLQLAARDNMQIVNPSNAAQYFHVLRRQVLKDWRKPLVIFTPKSLLRQPQAASPLADFEAEQFQPVLIDAADRNNSSPSKVIFCSGKIYYDVQKRREESKDANTWICRLEQLYPFPKEALSQIFKKFSKTPKYVWIQEEPENMGAGIYLQRQLEKNFSDLPRFQFIARPEAASPATGSASVHRLEQERLLTQLFADSAKGK